MEKDPTEIITQALRGDDQAFASLVHLYLGPLYGFIFLMMREKDATEDVVQEAFIKAWKHLDRFDEKQSFKTWLFTIAKNTAFDHLKKKKALPFSSFETEEGSLLDRHVMESPDILEQISREEAVQILDRVLQKLPVLYRTVLVLIYREDFDLQEAARILGEPYNTVKSRHQRALKKLRELAQDEDASHWGRLS